MIEAVIFDMDGVISDTQELAARIEHEQLAHYGIQLSPAEITRKYAGVADAEFYPDVFRSSRKPLDLPALIAEKQRMLFEGIQRGVPAIPGAPELIAALAAHQVPMGVASSSTLEFIAAVLGHLNVRQFFSSITSTTEVERGKPDPAIFLRAAQKLGKAPARCVVIEDGMSGMTAAKRAGIFCIGLVKDRSGGGYPADVLVESLAELTPERIMALR